MIYLKQAYLILKKDKKNVYCYYFIMGQINETSTPPRDMSTSYLRENEVKIIVRGSITRLRNFLVSARPLVTLSWEVHLRRCLSITAMTKKSRKSYIRTTSEGSRILSVEPFLIGTSLWLRVVWLVLSPQTSIFSFLQ